MQLLAVETSHHGHPMERGREPIVLACVCCKRSRLSIRSSGFRCVVGSPSGVRGKTCIKGLSFGEFYSFYGARELACFCTWRQRTRTCEMDADHRGTSAAYSCLAGRTLGSARSPPSYIQSTLAEARITSPNRPRVIIIHPMGCMPVSVCLASLPKCRTVAAAGGVGDISAGLKATRHGHTVP